MLIDSHCHLNYAGLVENQAAVLQRARALGVAGFLNISTKRAEWSHVVATAEREQDVWATIGIHPHEADGHTEVTAKMLVAAAHHHKVIGIGETGLDYFYEHSARDVQQSLFRSHIHAARELDIPVVIHTREAEADTIAILQEEMTAGPFRALIHCFTGSLAFSKQVLELGLSISFSGIVTFKNAKELRAVALEVPRDRLLIETDSPFLAPVPYRGKICEPAYIRDTSMFLAALRDVSFAELNAQTTANFYSLFTKAKA